MNLQEQLSYKPQIENKDKLQETDKFIVCGMGGSALSAGLIKTVKPSLDLLIHKDYGLPRVPEYFLKESLIILSSYSGNTEEVLECFDKSLEQNLNLAVITTGGKLLEKAKENNIPYIEIPNTDITPREAIGFSTVSLLSLLNQEMGQVSISELNDVTEIVKKINNKIPVIYSSTQNLSLAYNFKIRFNETSKIESFYNVFPEVNHNEIEGFQESNKDKFIFIFIKDENDHERIQKRIYTLKQIYNQKGFDVLVIEPRQENPWQKVFETINLANEISVKLAELNNKDPKETKTIDDFKNRISN